MIEFYTGVPGSGKTYRAVDHIYNSFFDEKHKDFGKYERLFTNINEFNFKYFNEKENELISGDKEKPTLLGVLKSVKNIKASPKDQFAKVSATDISQLHDEDDGGKRELRTNESALASDDVAFNLDMDQLIESLTELRELYLQKVGDSVLVKRAAELNLTYALFVIDESHNFFDAKNDVLIWWLSYHRHLHQDIILITQNLSLIYRKYLSFSEFFYRAVAPSLRIRGGVFTYHQFIKYQMFKTSHTDTIKVKFNKEVYALYGSGANTQSKKVIYKFIAIAVVLFIVVVILFNFISSSFGSSDNNITAPTQSSLSSTSLNVPVDRSKSFTVVCVGFDCSYLGQTISLSDLDGYVKQYGIKSIDSIMVSDGVFLRTFASNDKFISEVFNVQTDSSAAH